MRRATLIAVPLVAVILVPAGFYVVGRMAQHGDRAALTRVAEVVHTQRSVSLRMTIDGESSTAARFEQDLDREITSLRFDRDAGDWAPQFEQLVVGPRLYAKQPGSGWRGRSLTADLDGPLIVSVGPDLANWTSLITAADAHVERRGTERLGDTNATRFRVISKRYLDPVTSARLESAPDDVIRVRRAANHVAVDIWIGRDQLPVRIEQHLKLPGMRTASKLVLHGFEYGGEIGAHVPDAGSVDMLTGAELAVLERAAA